MFNYVHEEDTTPQARRKPGAGGAMAPPLFGDGPPHFLIMAPPILTKGTVHFLKFAHFGGCENYEKLKKTEVSLSHLHKKTFFWRSRLLPQGSS